MSDSATPWTTAHQASRSFTICWSLLKLMSIELVIPFNQLILCCPLLLLLSILPSIRVVSSDSFLCIRQPKCSRFSFNFSISPTSDYSELISFRMDWFDLLAVKGALRHHSLRVSILRCSDFFMIQLSHPYMTTGKTITLTIQNSVGKMMSLLFNT